MRDIRRDLQDRAQLLEEEITAAQTQFEQKVEQLKTERDARIHEIKDELSALGRLIDAEKRRMEGGSVQHTAEVATLPPNQQALIDFVLRKLGENGPMTLDQLRNLSIQEGFFSDPDAAGRGMQTILMAVARGGRIRQLPNGTFAPALLMDTLRQRQAV
ncbi:hypothetical protein A7A08_01038 [Methyloligella halotolerans]|uniref:Chromosome partition protein Smc n=1 Tax=Methyloligella halotolerans TaxID=1177755 RepID=A0A1E2S074_9HYPH|nr:hypothetical protein [Methyloligella halotolerans]ODA67871.1 hypothetical protein A7A08_01038 [Methyloligella halotolerans]